MIYPNCSEATVRLKIDGKTSEEIDKLKKKLMKVIIDGQNIDDDEEKPLEITGKSLESVEEEFNEKVYETYITEGSIWNIPTLTVNGQFPYNHSELMDGFIQDNNLEFEYQD